MGHCLIFLLLFCLLCGSVAPPGPTAYAAGLLGDFGIRDEQELGRKFEVLVRSRMPLIEDPEVKTYIQSLVSRLEKAMPPQPFPFNANVVLHPTMNAFAVPGGYVFVHTGLVMQLEHEAELAGVLAHEMAHVTQRHIASRMERSRAVSIASMVGALAGALLGGGGSGSGALLAGSMAAGQAAMLNYSRMDESEADEIGLQYLIRAGFNPLGMQGSFEKIRRKQWSSGMDIPEYLSTHPDVGNRINEIHARISGMPVSVRKRPYEDGRFNRVRTLIWARYGDPETALRFFLRAGASDCLAHMGRGIVAERRNQVKEARKAFDAALACSPDDPLVWREAGRFYYTVGDPDAERLLTRALKLDPEDLMAQFYYARLLSEAGRRHVAHEYYDSILRRLPEDAEIHYYYGRSLGESGQQFQGFLHLAYSALYRNDRRKVDSWLGQARAHARSTQEQEELDHFESIYRERRVHWKEGGGRS